MAGELLSNILAGDEIDDMLNQALKKVQAGQLDLSLTAQNETFDLSVASAADNARVIKALQDEALQKKLRDVARANAIRQQHSMF